MKNLLRHMNLTYRTEDPSTMSNIFRETISGSRKHEQ